MRSQALKDVYFAVARPVTKLNYYWYRVRHPGPQKVGSNGALWLNIGSGARYFDGFVNIEANVFRKKDIWLDIRNGLPFAETSVSGVYACHILEHFCVSSLLNVLIECRRVLKPGAGMRVLVPSLESAVQAYLKQDIGWFSDFPASFRSVGGKFFNFMLCDSQHKSMFDFSFMEELFGQAGFSRVTRETLGSSRVFPEATVKRIESSDAEYLRTSLIVEAQK